MKKATKVTLIVATACIVLGIVFSTAAYAMAGFDYRNFSTASRYTQQTYTANEGAYKEIVVNGSSENTSVVRTSGEVVEVEYYENDQHNYEITDNGDDVLTITERHEWGLMSFGFNINFTDTSTIIKVPESFEGVLRLHNSSGNVSTQELGTIEALYTDTASGDVLVKGTTVSGALEISTASGNIQCADSSADSAMIKTSSGAIKGDYLSDMTRFSAESLSGDIRLESVMATMVSLSAVSGDITTSEMIAETISVGTASGRISSQALTASDIELKAISGDIDATINGADVDYRIITQSSSGDIHVPMGNTGAEKSISMETASGDIVLGFM